MKVLLVGLSLFASLNVFAQNDDRSAKSGPHSVNAVASLGRGGFNFGAGYEFTYADSMGIEGHFRFFPKEDRATNPSDGFMVVGAGMAHHFYKKSWDLAFTPSVNIINIDTVSTTKDDQTTFGPGLSISLLCQMSPNVALGFDWSNYWVWFDRDYSGKRIDDLGVKVRASF